FSAVTMSAWVASVLPSNGAPRQSPRARPNSRPRALSRRDESVVSIVSVVSVIAGHLVARVGDVDTLSEGRCFLREHRCEQRLMDARAGYSRFPERSCRQPPGCPGHWPSTVDEEGEVPGDSGRNRRPQWSNGGNGAPLSCAGIVTRSDR